MRISYFLKQTMQRSPVFLCVFWLSVLLAGPTLAADPLLDFRMFPAPEVSQRSIREPLVSWLVMPEAETYCSKAVPKDGYVTRPEGCVYWQVSSSRCTIVTESPTSHSQLGHLLLHCMKAK